MMSLLEVSIALRYLKTTLKDNDNEAAKRIKFLSFSWPSSPIKKSFLISTKRDCVVSYKFLIKSECMDAFGEF